MKLLGIIASTEAEISLLISYLQDKESLIIQGKSFYKGILKNTEVVLCICGIGKVNAAHGTTILLERFRTDFIFNIGVAGAYPSSGLKVGDLVIAEKEVYGDEGLISRSEVKEKNKIDFYTMDKIKLPLCVKDKVQYFNEFPTTIPKVLSHIPKGNFVTVSTCTGTLKKAKEIEKRFRAICENMEGAAIAHICHLSEIPVVEIRSISNIIGDRLPKPLKRSEILKASKNCQKLLLTIWDKLSPY